MAYKSYKNGDVTVKKGNRKLSEAILIFNLPAQKTCPNHRLCVKNCYALRSERYPEVKACRESNLVSTKKSCFVARMVELIERTHSETVRVHESGDFYSQEYANKWTEIARRLPGVQFYCYTKSPYRPTGHNWNIVESILPDGSLNFGPRKAILQKAKQFKAKVCPCGLSKLEHICGTRCKACQTYRYVVFVQH